MHFLNLQLVAPDLAAQHAFYTKVFQFPVLHHTAAKLEFQVGASRLTFTHAAVPMAGVYHFAFNIPENQFAEATDWLRQRVPLIADKTGADTFYSAGWDAHMVYFYDPAGNIAELIARHSLPSASTRPFSGQNVLGVSEIGLAADDVTAAATAIAARGNTSFYGGTGSATFTAVGHEEQLFIVVKNGRTWAPDTGQAAVPLPLTAITHTANGPLTWHFPEPT